jgi:hypothetical protein
MASHQFSILVQAYVDLAKELQKKNVPIEGIGAQGHFTGVVDPLVFKVRKHDLYVYNSTSFCIHGYRTCNLL